MTIHHRERHHDFLPLQEVKDITVLFSSVNSGFRTNIYNRLTFRHYISCNLPNQLLFFSSWIKLHRYLKVSTRPLKRKSFTIRRTLQLRADNESCVAQHFATLQKYIYGPCTVWSHWSKTLLWELNDQIIWFENLYFVEASFVTPIEQLSHWIHLLNTTK